MCGARDMVFPYLNMVSYWGYLLAVLILVAGFFRARRARPARGWTLYAAASHSPPVRPAPRWGIVCMLASLATFIVAFTMGGLNYGDRPCCRRAAAE